MSLVRNPGWRTFLAAGILIRLITYCFLGPEISDGHGDVVRFLVEHHRLPLVWEVHEAHNAPLYYLLAAPILAWTGSMKMVQALSLVCSVAALWLLLRLIHESGLIADARARLYASLLVCALPQFVMISLYVSNDTLAILLGAALAWQTWRYVEAPTWKSVVLLALILGFGLLTKTTFVAAAPLLLALVWWHPREKRRGWNGLLRADVFLILVLALGGFKFADNWARYRDPFYNNMDLQEDWHLNHIQTYRGFWSFADVNIGRLLVSPVVSPTTDGAYPVLLYGTFWYQHISESNFLALRSGTVRYFGSAVFLAALAPTLAFLWGLTKLARGLPALLGRFDATRPEDLRLLTATVLAAIMVSSIALLDVTALQYHEWSIFQGRFLYPWIFGGLAAFAAGMPDEKTHKLAARTLRIAMMSLTGLFVLYLAIEIGAIARIKLG